MRSVIFRIFLSISFLLVLVDGSASKGAFARFFQASLNKKPVYKEELPPIGKLILTNFAITWKNQSNFEALGCVDQSPCFELWICGGQRFKKFPERNVCDRIKYEDKWNPNVKELQLNFGDTWHLGEWHLDIAGNTLVENKRNRKLLFETTQAYLSKNAESGMFQYVSEDHNVKVTADLQIMCNADRDGPRCQEKCEQTGADKNANWFCNDSGSKECRSGWRGPGCKSYFCEQECQHGHCVGPNQCRCNSGYLGAQCNVSSYCTANPNPCMYDGICRGSLSDPTHYICECPPGSAGRNCEVEVICLDGSCPLVPVTKTSEGFSSPPLMIAMVVLFVIIFVLLAIIAYISKQIVRKRTRVISSSGTSNSELDHLNGDANSTVILIEGAEKPQNGQNH